MTVRIGQGFDVHAVSRERQLVLGGVPIEWERGGLQGHSDADVLTHAITNALFGSLSLGDLGSHFPDDDPQWRGVSSLELLAEAQTRLHRLGWHIVNCDATVIAQEPKLGPYIDTMRRTLAEVMQVAVDAVSIKATTTERLGVLGRSEAIAAQAVVLVGHQTKVKPF